MAFSDPDWIRTNDLLLRRQLLYPAELRDRNIISNILIEPMIFPTSLVGMLIQLSYETKLGLKLKV